MALLSIVISATDCSTCGQGGPGFQFKDEPVLQSYATGAVSVDVAGGNGQVLDYQRYGRDYYLGVAYKF